MMWATQALGAYRAQPPGHTPLPGYLGQGGDLLVLFSSSLPPFLNSCFSHLSVDTTYIPYVSPISRARVNVFGIFRVVTTTTVNLRTFVSPQGEAPCLSAVFPPPQPRAITNRFFCLCRFAYSGHFVYMGSYSVWSFVTGVCHVA